MSVRIICTVDHRPEGANSGALVAAHLDSDGPIEWLLDELTDRYPRCELKVVTS